MQYVRSRIGENHNRNSVFPLLEPSKLSRPVIAYLKAVFGALKSVTVDRYSVSIFTGNLAIDTKRNLAILNSFGYTPI